MKSILLIPFISFSIIVHTQVINKSFNNSFSPQPSCGITTDALTASITTRVVYNAKPEGYIVAFTTSFIGENVEDVENKMNKKIDSLIKKVKKINIEDKNVIVDVISFDPIFSFINNSKNPDGYKVTLNLSFKISDYNLIRQLTKTCLEFEIYDLINIKPFIKNTKYIYDSLANKSIEILNFKKSICEKLSWNFTGGHSEFSKCKNVYYPSEHYLKSSIKNSALFSHNISQNSTVNFNRKLNIDLYNNFDLKDVDYIYNSDLNIPVIQFYYQLNYLYIKDKPKNEEQNVKEIKSFYVLDKEGSLIKLKL